MVKAGKKTNSLQVYLTQYERIVDKFGSPKNLHKALNEAGETDIALSTIYKWNYPLDKRGGGGIIPPQRWPAIMRAARLYGILISSEDLDPRDIPVRVFQRDRKAKYHDL